MEDTDQSLREVFADAESARVELENSWDSNSTAYQQNLLAALAAYEKCLAIINKVSLFSTNEALDDVTTNDLQYV